MTDKSVFITADGCFACQIAKERYKVDLESGDLEEMSIDVALDMLVGLVDCLLSKDQPLGVPIFATVDNHKNVTDCVVGIPNEGMLKR